MAHPPKRRRAGPKKSAPSRELVLTIDHLGHRGDGIARLDGRPIYVPGSLPGESVRASVSGERGTLFEILAAAPDRIAPFCPHFGLCGGCTSQHMSEIAYTAWKRAIVETALKNRGLDAIVNPLVDAHGHGRRRATFHALRAGEAWLVGYSSARSHRIVDLDACPILVAEMNRAPGIIRALAGHLTGTSRFDILATQTDSGLDLQLIDIQPLTLATRTILAECAERFDLARIAVDDETIVMRRQPRVQMGPVSVAVPPGAFLQATTAGEHVLAERVCTHFAGAHRIADLFSGLGPFALRLAVHASVEAFDSDPALIAALTRSARETPKLHPIKAEIRDLFGRPVVNTDLNRYDGVVFDPPRAGAEAQARMLAASTVPLVAAVSCEPASFARDAALLVGGGYRLEHIYPVDQFKWSPHVEIVGIFKR